MKIYLICGKARSGKNTTADIIKDYYGDKACILEFTNTLKRYAKDYFNWDGSDETKPRKLLQDLGNTARSIDPDFLINHICDDIKLLADYFSVFVVSDVRFPREIEEIKNRFSDVISIYIEREGYVSPLSEDTKNDITEHALDNYDNYDYKLLNSDLDKLKDDIINLLEGGK